MNVVLLKEKVEALKLTDVDTDPILIAELYQLSQHDSKKKFKYFKRYGDQVMYYSEEYLEQTPVEQLLLKDLCNHIY
ncbi:hypothetical protein [Lysinibacillus sp. RC79]|uniref:hypothetical protein n=1 Tax=Lysinibacillus sp. RC79 TaxID=3156296 RepID=UPI0035136094